MTKSIFKVILLCVIYATANSVYCQKDWQSYQMQKSLPKNAKKEIVKYKSYSYTAVGYILKKQFVEGQIITFYNTKIKKPPYFDTSFLNYPNSISNAGETDPIISGIYFVKDSISYLASTIIERLNRESEYSRVNIQLIFKVTNTYDGKKLTVKPDEAKELSIETVDLVNFSGDYKRGEHPFTLQKRSNTNDYVLKIGLYGDTLETSISSDYLTKRVIPYISYLFKITRNNSEEIRINLDFDNYINNSKDVRLKYANGDIFVGKVTEGLTPDDGEYTFSNGEVFKGKCNGRPSIWQDGEWVFIDGSVESGSWIKKYNASEVDLSSAKTLTDKHKLVIRIYEEELQKQQKQQEEEKISKQQEEEKKQIKEQQDEDAIKKRKANFTTKFGEYYGTLLFEKKFILGMTKEMIKYTMGEVADFFDTTNNGHIEIWVFSIDRVLAYFVAIGDIYNYQRLKQSLKEVGYSGMEALIGRYAPFVPKKIVFTNNKVTSISN